MAYTDKKVIELRNMCQARRLATSGTKATLIYRLEKYQEENLIKQEPNEMQIDIPVTQQQQQEVTASPHISETSQEVLNNVKNECEATNDMSQTMETDDFSTKDSSYLPQQSLEQKQQDMPPNVDMSNEYPQSIDHVEQQQIDQPPTVPSVVTSPIVTHEVSAAEVPSSTNDSSEQNDHDKSKPTDDSSEKTSYSTYPKYEIDRELLTRLKNLETLRMFSRGITMNQGQTNGVPYDYDLLLDIVQKSVIYKDGEIPDCLRYDYDSTYGATYFGEPECMRNVGMELFVRQS